MGRPMEPCVPASFLPRCKTQIDPNTSGFPIVHPMCLRRKSYKGAIIRDVVFLSSKRRARTGQATKATSLRDVVHINKLGGVSMGATDKTSAPCEAAKP